MRVSQVEMSRNHKRIVKSASRLMRKRGVEPTSVGDVMKKAGLTHGGFYRHFDSKESLVSAALEDAFTEVLDVIAECHRDFGLEKGTKEYYRYYLSEGHLKHPELGCPVAALGLDVSRSTASVKTAFSEGFRDVVERLSQSEDGEREDNRTAAIQKLCMVVGAVMIARATDAATSLSVLEACKASPQAAASE